MLAGAQAVFTYWYLYHKLSSTNTNMLHTQEEREHLFSKGNYDFVIEFFYWYSTKQKLNSSNQSSEIAMRIETEVKHTLSQTSIQK